MSIAVIVVLKRFATSWNWYQVSAVTWFTILL